MSAGTIDKAPEDLQRLVGELEAEGVHHFNPVRFRYIRAMADRSLEQAGAVVPVVVEKALLAIAQYQRDLSRERAVAEATVEQLAQTHPEAGPSTQAMLASCDFDGIRQLAGRLQRPATENGLSQLVEQLGLGGTSTAGTPECAHLETILRRQEAAVLSELQRVGHAWRCADFGPAVLSQEIAIEQLRLFDGHGSFTVKRGCVMHLGDALRQQGK